MEGLAGGREVVVREEARSRVVAERRRAGGAAGATPARMRNGLTDGSSRD